MSAGRYRHRITIERNTPTTSAAGQRKASWSTFATRWAEVIPAGGSETEETDSHQLRASVTHRIRLRSDSKTRAIVPEMRVVWGSRVLHVKRAWQVDGRRIEVELECQEEF